MMMSLPSSTRTTWGGNNLLDHRSDSKIMWNNSAPDVGLVNHAQSSHLLGVGLGFCGSMEFKPKRVFKVETLSNPSYDDATLELIAHKSSNHKWVTEVREEF